MRVIWSPEAREDLREIYSNLATENPYAARALHERIQQGVQLLRDNPNLGRPGRVPATRELVISGTLYIVPYQIREQRLELLRVYHTARKWPECGFETPDIVNQSGPKIVMFAGRYR